MATLVLLFFLGLADLVSAAPASTTDPVFPWKVLRGSPRSATPIQTAEQAKNFLLGPGKPDLSLVTSSEDATKTVVLLEQHGAAALRTIRVKPGNLVSEDNGATWQVAEFRNIVFGTSVPVVFKGPLSVEWVNYAGGVAYYPVGLNSEWVPVIQGACGNAFLWHRPRKTTPPPTVTGQVVQPLPPPIHVGAMGPPPDTSGRGYQQPARVEETRSVHTVATVGQIPIPKQEVRVSQELLNNVLNGNQNVNTVNAIMQQLQQMVVPITINN